MKILGQECELVGVPFADLKALNVPEFEICEEIFAHHVYYSSEQLFRDIPEFHPQISLGNSVWRKFLKAWKGKAGFLIPMHLTWEDRNYCPAKACISLVPINA